MSVEELVKELNEVDDHLTTMAADTLEELAAENERLRRELSATTAERNRAQEACQQISEKAEAALAEAKRENEALRGERDFLQEILDARPAINAALPESYIRWSQSLYSGEVARASLSARNAGGKNAE